MKCDRQPTTAAEAGVEENELHRDVMYWQGRWTSLPDSGTMDKVQGDGFARVVAPVGSTGIVVCKAVGGRTGCLPLRWQFNGQKGMRRCDSRADSSFMRSSTVAERVVQRGLIWVFPDAVSLRRGFR